MCFNRDHSQNECDNVGGNGEKRSGHGDFKDGCVSWSEDNRQGERVTIIFLQEIKDKNRRLKQVQERDSGSVPKDL